MQPKPTTMETSGSPIRHSSFRRKLGMHSAAQPAADERSEPGGHEGVAREHDDSHQPELAVLRTGDNPPDQNGELTQERAGGDGSRPAGSQEAEDESTREQGQRIRRAIAVPGLRLLEKAGRNQPERKADDETQSQNGSARQARHPNLQGSGVH